MLHVEQARHRIEMGHPQPGDFQRIVMNGGRGGGAVVEDHDDMDLNFFGGNYLIEASLDTAEKDRIPAEEPLLNVGVESFGDIRDLYPDDVTAQAERIKKMMEEGASQELLVANQTFLAVMVEFFEEDETFLLHKDADLNRFVKDTIRREVDAAAKSQEGKTAISDEAIEEILANAQGFPPYSVAGSGESGAVVPFVLPEKHESRDIEEMAAL